MLLKIYRVPVPLRHWLQSHAALLCALTICTLFLCAAQVSSKQTPVDQLPPAPDGSFALKNPNAFDPARRRNVRAMKIPRESAADMAHGIDAAEAEAPPADDVDETASRLSLNAQ